MKRVVNELGKLNWGKGACAVFALCAVTAITSSAQTFKTLATLDGANNGSGPCPPNYSACPEGGLVQGTDGNLYGTTYAGGANGYGTVFRVTLKGRVTALHSFEGADGANPAAGLVLGTNGNFYGTTYAGGANGYGTVFRITRGGELTTLYSFCAQSSCADGEFPIAGLVQATNGKFYGTTETGGANDGAGCNYANQVGCGTVFEITPSGKLTTIYSFCPENACVNGEFPTGPLVQGTDGNLYGTTYSGSPGTPLASDSGSVFKITTSGKLTTIYTFVCSGPLSNLNCPNGSTLPGGLVQAADGSFYGTTSAGGANDSCVVELGSIFGCGTVFHLTTSGALTSLYSFCAQTGCADGELPYAGLLEGTDGNFYGTTFSGFPGMPSYGTVFQITPGGALTTLHTFCSQSGCPDGSNPLAGLVQATNGDFYGTTSSVCGAVITTPTCGVVTTTGTVFSLSMGLPPFVKTVPTSGKVGSAVIILGNSLTGATSVTFNGTPATAFTVVSATEIKATVPIGATTGTVQVTTPSGTLSSNVSFAVL